jgi:hypothetical protein
MSTIVANNSYSPSSWGPGGSMSPDFICQNVLEFAQASLEWAGAGIHDVVENEAIRKKKESSYKGALDAVDALLRHFAPDSDGKTPLSEVEDQAAVDAQLALYAKYMKQLGYELSPDGSVPVGTQWGLPKTITKDALGALRKELKAADEALQADPSITLMKLNQGVADQNLWRQMQTQVLKKRYDTLMSIVSAFSR